MSVVWSLVRTGGFTALFVAAAVGGRLTVIKEVGLGLIWPAAGVAVVWFAVQRRAWWPVDALALMVATVGINLATGSSTALAGASAAANLVQVLVVVRLLDRWCPQLWGFGGRAPFSRLVELWRFLTAAALGTLAGAVIGPTGVWLFGGHWSWLTTTVWLTRNTVSVLIVGAAGLHLGHLITRHGGLRGWWAARREARRGDWAGRGDDWARRAELAALLTCSTGVYLLAFVADRGLPLAFPLLTVTVWAALRFGVAFVVYHGLIAGTAAAVFTLYGLGPFATIGTVPVRALVVQAFVGVVAVVGLVLALSRAERDAATANLAEAERAASAQARLLAAIVESMGDGLVVVDETGRVRLSNPATASLLGDVVTGQRIADPAAYGLFHPDGRPLTAGDMPHARAFTGQPVRGMDVYVRHPRLPETLILNVTSTALPAATVSGVPSAVVVLRDVTAERRHRDELATFAGVVAHDVLNPLATIEGWAGILNESVEDVPDPARHEIEDGLFRITRAISRMRHLVNDLLAFTTARDATLALADVELCDLIADIAAARADHAAAAGGPQPRFHTGDLSRVHADPVLVRQLLDNLIGNAVKYTAPGAAPEITVTSAPTADGRIRVEVTDRGIGIPPGQHEAIFGNFHRAHRGEAYTGTGLGLTICKRIVERHGGTIVATDNPAGPGTRVSFTLPAASTRASAPGEPVPTST